MPYVPPDARSEATSFSQEESNSPTDGYFMNRRHPQDFYVQSPTGASDAKPQAVSEDFLPSSTTSTTSNSYHFGHRPDCYSVNETSPLLTTSLGAPPPSYLDAMGRSFDYEVVGQDEDLERRESRLGLLSLDERRDPESIGPSRDLEEEILYALPSLGKGKRRAGFWHYWNKRRCTLFGAAAFVALALLIAIIAAVSRRDSPTVVAPPSLQPSLPDQEGKDPFLNGFAVWPSHCGNRSAIKSLEWSFDSPSAFQFMEDVQSDGQVIYGITGDTHLAPAPPDQISDIRVELYIVSSQPMTVQDVQYSQSTSGIELSGASFEESVAGTSACMVMATIAYIKPGTTLKKLQIESQHTKLTLHSNLDLGVEDTSILLTSGSLKASAGSLESRETVIDIVSGSVSGTYSLYDLLSIKTQSGAVGISVEPKDASKDSPKPADFQVRSRSGSVNVKYSSLAPPDRDYKVAIEANMGSVTATLIHGSETTINAYSGSITGTIIPYRASNSSSLFTTNTVSGSTKLTLTSPYVNPGAAMTALNSVHQGKSGSIRLNYPQEWMGQLQGGTQSGRLSLSGKDVRVIREGGGAAGKRIVATKGEGNSSMTFETMSGSCTIQVGNT